MRFIKVVDGRTFHTEEAEFVPVKVFTIVDVWASISTSTNPRVFLGRIILRPGEGFRLIGTKKGKNNETRLERTAKKRSTGKDKARKGKPVVVHGSSDHLAHPNLHKPKGAGGKGGRG